MPCRQTRVGAWLWSDGPHPIVVWNNSNMNSLNVYVYDAGSQKSGNSVKWLPKNWWLT